MTRMSRLTLTQKGCRSLSLQLQGNLPDPGQDLLNSLMIPL